jgi:hypothetical protein
MFTETSNNHQLMKKILGLVLIVAALALGYFGFTKMQDNKAEIKIGDLELSATDEGSNQEAYLLMGAGAVCLIAGLMLSRGKS